MKKIYITMIILISITSILSSENVCLRFTTDEEGVGVDYTLWCTNGSNTEVEIGYIENLNVNSTTLRYIPFPAGYYPDYCEITGHGSCGNSLFYLYPNDFYYGELPENPGYTCYFNYVGTPTQPLTIPSFPRTNVLARIYSNIDTDECEITYFEDHPTRETIVLNQTLKKGWNDVYFDDVCFNQSVTLTVTYTNVGNEYVEELSEYADFEWNGENDRYETELELVFENKPLHLSWNWESLPKMNINEWTNNAYTDIIPLLENNIVSNDYDDLKMISNGGELYFLSQSWDPSYYNIRSSDGFKLIINEPERYYTANGQRVAEDTEIDLESSDWIYIGYWLPHSVNIDVAFGEHWSKVYCLKAEEWTYLDMNNPRGGDEPIPSMKIRPLHYGEGYMLKLREDINDFQWNTDPGRSTNFHKPDPENFNYEKKADYEVIDVMDIESGITEIGVYADDACLGAVVVEDEAEQVLVYSDRMNRDDVPFSFVTVSGRGDKQTISNYSVFSEATGEYQEQLIISGNQEYSRIKLGTPDDTQIPNSNPVTTRNYPNPFQPNTVISYNLPQNTSVKLEVYNMKGQLVKILYNGQQNKGDYSITWLGDNQNNEPVTSGVYFYRLQTGNEVINKKMILMR